MTGIRFEDAYIPYHLDSLTGRRVIVLAPHPDDETFGCGGAIMMHRAANDPVRTIFLTDGAASSPNEGAKQRARLIRQRKTEALAAARILGVTDTEFWMYPDRGLECSQEAVARLADAISQFKPDLLYSPSLHEFHPDHRACAELAWSALSGSPHPCSLVFYEVNRPFKANTLIDISDLTARKQQACEAYRSQLGNIPYDDISLSLNRFRALTVSHAATHAEAFEVVPHNIVATTSADRWLLDQFLSERANVERTKAPLVSIIIRTKERPHLLAEALLSVEAQTYRNLEVIVVVDAADEGTTDAASARGRLAPRFIRSTRPGRTASANIGLAEARGKYVCFLDDDDLLYPNHVERLVAVLEESDERRVAYTECDVGRYESDGARLHLLGDRQVFSREEYSREKLLNDNFIPIMSVMFERECAHRIGGFDETLDHFEDWDFWIRLSACEPFYRLAGASCEYRQLIRKTTEEALNATIDARIALYIKYPEHLTT